MNRQNMGGRTRMAYGSRNGQIYQHLGNPEFSLNVHVKIAMQLGVGAEKRGFPVSRVVPAKTISFDFTRVRVTTSLVPEVLFRLFIKN